MTKEIPDNDWEEITADDWELVRGFAEEVLEEFLWQKEAELDKFEEVIGEPAEVLRDWFKSDLEHHCEIEEAMTEIRAKRCLLENEIKPILYKWFDERYEDAREQAQEKHYYEQEEYECFKKDAEAEKKANERKEMPYKEFLKTDYWRQVREKVIERDKRCRFCGTTDNFEVHHITYDHRGDELNYLNDLTLLCSDCHTICHEHYTWERNY